MSDMTPDEAQVVLEMGSVLDDLPAARRALETVAAMRVEHDHGVVDWEQVDGRYEVYHRVRLVGEWRDADPAEANAERARGCAVQAVIAAAKHQAAAQRSNDLDHMTRLLNPERRDT